MKGISMKKMLSLALCLVMGAGMQQASATLAVSDVVNAQVGASAAVGLAGSAVWMLAQYKLTLPEDTEASFKGFIQYLTTTGHIAEALAIWAAVGGAAYVGYGKITNTDPTNNATNTNSYAYPQSQGYEIGAEKPPSE